MSRYATIATEHGDRPVAWIGTEILNLPRAFALEQVAAPIPRTLCEVLFDEAARAAAENLIRRVEEDCAGVRQRLREKEMLLPCGQVRLRAPLRPRLIVCSGHTYESHAREMGARAPAYPMGFIKSPHCVVGPNDPVILPRKHWAMVDFEGEFALVIGRRCHNVSVDDAMACVAGYVLINDVSARDWVDEARRTGDMFMNTLGKQFPSFCPLGPCIATPDAFPNPHEALLTTTVNGQVMQSASTAELRFSIPEIVSFWSQWYCFEPGDVITTGSPPGVGAARQPPVFLREGDSVTVCVREVGELTNPVCTAQVNA